MACQCTVCNKGNAEACSSCHSAAYCSSFCSEADESLHKLICGALKNLSDRPTSSHKLSILLPEEAELPQLLWVDPAKMPPSDLPRDCEGLSQSHNTAHESTKNYRLCRFREIKRNIARRFDLPNLLHIWFCENEDLPANRCVIKITRGQSLFDPKGPVIIQRSNVERNRIEQCRLQEDITAADLRYAVDYFVSHGIERVHNKIGNCIKGIRINCWGERKVSGKPLFEIVDVPRDHPVFLSEYPLEIPSALGLRLFMYKIRPDLMLDDETTWDKTENMSPKWNLVAMALHVCCDPRNDQWGRSTMSGVAEPGSVFVVCSHGEDLDVELLDALCYYSRFKLLPMFSNSKLRGRRSAILEHLTPYKFREFFIEFKRNGVDTATKEWGRDMTF